MDYLSASPEEHLYRLLRVISRRRVAVVSTVLTVSILLAAALLSLPTRYTATAALILEPAQTRVLDIVGSDPGNAGLDRELAKSEVEIFRSRGLASKVIQNLKLHEDPEFNSALRPVSFLDMIMGGSFDTPTTQGDVLDGKVIEEFHANLEVASQRGSRVIIVSFSSVSAPKAARIANAVVDQYLLDQLEAKFAISARAEEWLRERLNDLGSKLATSQEAVETLERSAGLVGFDEAAMTSQLRDLETQFALQHSGRVEVETRLTQIEAGFQTQDGAARDNPFITSPLLESLRVRAVQIENLAAEIAAKNGEDDPRVVALLDELSGQRGQIETAANNFVGNLRNNLSLLRAGENGLATRVGEIREQLNSASENQAQLRDLQSEVDANRAIYETLLTRFKAISGQDSIQQADARYISAATAPTDPSFPKKRLIIALTLVIAVFLGVGVAYLVEIFDQSFRSARQAARVTGVPVLAFVPDLSGSSETTAFNRAIRSLFVGLQLSHGDHVPGLIAVTSAVAGEATATITRSLGRMIALTGRRVVIVDGNWHQTESAKTTSPGLAQLLAKEASLDDAVQHDEETGVDTVGHGQLLDDAPGLVDSDRIKAVVAELTERYDVVVIDSPAVLAEPEARLYSHVAEKTILVVRWGKTRRESVRVALEQLTEAGCDVAGIVMSSVDAKSYRRHAFD